MFAYFRKISDLCRKKGDGRKEMDYNGADD